QYPSLAQGLAVIVRSDHDSPRHETSRDLAVWPTMHKRAFACPRTPLVLPTTRAVRGGGAP
ncbi:MAG: hypothetical protein AAF078_07685, partial [Planctomycetota bacterium]